METQIYLYQVLNFDASKNFKIKAILYFLENNSVKWRGPTSIQYQKPSLNMSVKLNLSQLSVIPTFEYNYVRMKWAKSLTESVNMYFFVSGWQWLSENTIRIDLTMDVLNSISFSFDKRTRILRQHGKQFSSFSRSGQQLSIFRDIDLHDEGITASLYRSEELQEMTLTPSGGEGAYIPYVIKKNWYLIYRSVEVPDSNIPNQIYNCYVACDDEFSIYDAQGIASPVIMYPKDYTLYQFIYIIGTGAGERVTYTDGSQQYDLTLEEGEFIAIDPQKTYFYVWHYKNNLPVGERVKVESITVVKAQSGRWGNSPRATTADGVNSGRNKVLQINAGVSYTFTVNSIDALDRTDPRLIKIIEIPYQPIIMKVVGLPGNNRHSIEGDNVVFDRETSFLKINFPWETIAQKYSTNGDLLSPLHISEFLKTHLEYDEEKRNDEYESKVYQSAFYNPTIVYDSFSYSIPLEKVEHDTLLITFNIDFHFTSTINSRFLFKFDIPYSYEIEEDFEKILYISRNNELPLLNSEYLNYIRNGYNYDVKSKLRSDVSSGVRIVSNVISAAAGGALVGPGGSAVGAFAGLVTGVYNAISNSIQNEQNIQEKLQEKRNRAVSVENADAYDLMNVYAKNRLLSCVYKLSDTMEKNIKDLFYYFGYSVNEIGIPDTTSRIYFNFVQCDAVFENEGLIRREYLNRLKEIFAEGVTYIHRYNKHTGGFVYDLKQEMNNREVAFDDFLRQQN